MPEFIPGLKLCQLFYEKEVKPILGQFIDNTDLMQQLSALRQLRLVYETR